MTIVAPTIGAASASPQQLAWNIGTTGRMTSNSIATSMASGIAAIIECRTLERCEYTTPLGLPVVPDV